MSGQEVILRDIIGGRGTTMTMSDKVSIHFLIS
jgi:hypothetical protein